MRIAFIWPRGFETRLVIPLAFGYLKSNISNGRHDVRIFDCALSNIGSDSPMLQRIINEFNPEMVGVSCWSITYPEAKNILEKVKSINKAIITVIGGIHPTLKPEAVMENENVGFLFRGEAELFFSEFVEEIEKERPNLSKIKGLTYRCERGDIVSNEMAWEKDLDKVKIPDYDAIRLEEYIGAGYRLTCMDRRNAPIWVTRGCPYRCEYCSAPVHNGRLIRRHSVGYVIDWIRFLYHHKQIRTVNIIDDNFTFDLQYAKEICEAIIRLNLKDLHMGTPNGIRIERTDKELFELMKRAGWELVTFGPESGSIKTLEVMKKDIDPEIVPRKVEEIKKAGLKTAGFFIVGYPGETRKDIKDTIRLMRKSKFNFFFLSNFQPLPGTPVYDRLVEEGKISSDFLPKEYTSGYVYYVPEGLKNFNFSLLRLKEYLYLAITKPLNLHYMLRHFDFRLMAKRIVTNSINMINKLLGRVFLSVPKI